MDGYGIFVLAAAGACALAFLAMWLRAVLTPHAREYAQPMGSSGAGTRLAYTNALAPWAREKSRRHLPPRLAEAFYARSVLSIHFHMAIFISLGLLISSPFRLEVPPGLRPIPGAFIGIGLIGGLGLLLKRIFDRRLRALSYPEDYFAGVVSNVLLIAAMLAIFLPGTRQFFQLFGGLLLLYAPVGKIRHMVFIFPSLLYLGGYFGRRGVRPKARKVHADA